MQLVIGMPCVTCNGFAEATLSMTRYTQEGRPVLDLINDLDRMMLQCPHCGCRHTVGGTEVFDVEYPRHGYRPTAVVYDECDDEDVTVYVD